jgi:hypothetical protein
MRGVSKLGDNRMKLPRIPNNLRQAIVTLDPCALRVTRECCRVDVQQIVQQSVHREAGHA